MQVARQSRADFRWAGIRRLVTFIFFSTTINAYAEERKFCSDIEILIEHSYTRFLAIRGERNDNPGGYNSLFFLPDASSCIIMQDIEKSSYQCSWEFQYGEARADRKFDHFREALKSCIGYLAKERKDQLVNHPDYYLSFYYLLPSGQVNVTFKKKVKLMKSYVSIGIDGFTK